MAKRILLTGATDGIGLETAKSLVSLEHHVLLHGRNAAKLDKVERSLTALWQHAHIEGYVADLSRMSEVESLAKAVSDKYKSLDVLINNAGVFVAPDPVTPDGLDLRFAVNAIARLFAHATTIAATRQNRESHQSVVRCPGFGGT